MLILFVQRHRLRQSRASPAFRRLQPGEAAQTFAPVSDLILVDREKLLAVGISKTVVPGAAWYLIFWKAAAAGWRSYSVGGAGEIGLAPDWPYEEAEFVTRVLSGLDDPPTIEYVRLTMWAHRPVE